MEMLPPTDPFFEDADRRFMPKVRSSSFFVVEFSGQVDVRLSIVVGTAVTMGKPMLIVAVPGAVIPDSLRLAAALVVTANPKTPEGRIAVDRAICQMVDALPRSRPEHN